MLKNCLICQNTISNHFFSYFDKGLKRERAFYRCDLCCYVFMNPDDRLTSDEEKKRYEGHNNNAEEQGYVDFLMKFYTPFSKYLVNDAKSGLDYGAGPGPVLAEIFKRNGYQMDIYDPYFWPNLDLKKEYDFISCTEAIEHFYEPAKEIENMLSLLKKGGVLGFMTQFLSEEIDFEKWWYKNDPTHVGFFNHESFEFISKKYNLEILHLGSGLAFLKKN